VCAGHGRLVDPEMLDTAAPAQIAGSVRDVKRHSAAVMCAWVSEPSCARRGLVLGEERVEFDFDVIRVWPARVAGARGA